MAFKEISDFGDDPLFQTLVSQGVTTSPEFAFELSSSGAELFLGGVNQNKYTGSFTTSQVSNTVCSLLFNQCLRSGLDIDSRR